MSITDDGFLRGDGAFEMLRLYGGRPFALADHLDRLDRSAAGIFLDYDRAAFEREIEALLDANGHRDAALRLVLSRGGRRIAIIEPPARLRPRAELSSVRYQPTIVLTGLKTLSYGGNMRATRLAQRDGADEALLVRARRHRAGGADLDALLGRRRRRPAHPGARGGRARLDHARAHHATRARDRGRELQAHATCWTASEVFLASSLREVQGVSSLDGLEFTCPGPVTSGSRVCSRSTSRPSSRARRKPRGRHEPRPHRRAAPDPRDRARLRRPRDHARGRATTTAPSASTSSS